MSDEYMPSTDEIRELVRAASAFETLSGIPASEVLAAFDRWLAAHDEQVRASERERLLAAIRRYPRGSGSRRKGCPPAEQKESRELQVTGEGVWLRGDCSACAWWSRQADTYALQHFFAAHKCATHQKAAAEQKESN